MIDPKELGRLQLSLLQQVVEQRRQLHLVKTFQVWPSIPVEYFPPIFSAFKIRMSTHP